MKKFLFLSCFCVFFSFATFSFANNGSYKVGGTVTLLPSVGAGKPNQQASAQKPDTQKPITSDDSKKGVTHKNDGRYLTVDNLHMLYYSQENDLAALKSLLSAGVGIDRRININAQDQYGRTALMIAVKNGNEPMVHYLMLKGANPILKDFNGDSPLHIAVKLGYLNIVQAIFSQVQANSKSQTSNVNKRSGGNNQFSMLAKSNNQNQEKNTTSPDIIGNNRANDKGYPVDVDRYPQGPFSGSAVDLAGLVNLRNAQGDTPLSIASRLGYNQIMYFLLSKGADPNIKNNQGYTSLMFSANNGDQKGVQLLLGQPGINVNQIDNQGNSALILASYRGSLHIIADLLKAGADPNIKNNKGTSPLLVVAREDYPIAMKLLFQSPVVKADPNIKNNEGDTPLIVAAQQGYSDVVNILIQNGAFVNMKDNKQYNALLWATFNGYADVVKVLLQIPDTQVNVHDAHGNTPLIFASAENYPDVAKLLLSNGASLFIKNNDGYSALSIAKHRKYTNLLNLLHYYSYRQLSNINNGKDTLVAQKKQQAPVIAGNLITNGQDAAKSGSQQKQDSNFEVGSF